MIQMSNVLVENDLPFFSGCDELTSPRPIPQYIHYFKYDGCSVMTDYLARVADTRSHVASAFPMTKLP